MRSAFYRVDELQRSSVKGRPELGTSKSDKGFFLIPALSVTAALRKQRQRHKEWRLLAGQSWNSSDYVFTSKLGTLFVHGTVSKTYKRILEESGLPGSHLHDLWHTCATAALRSGDSIKDIQETLGHHDAAFTMNQYMHITEQMKKASADRMGAS